MLARVAAAGLAIFVAAVLAQHAIEPSFGVSGRTISEFAHGEAGWLITVGFLAWAVSLASLGTLLLRRDPRPGGRSRLEGAALLAAALGVLLVACFPTDRGAVVPAEVVQATAAGRLHDAGSALAALSLLVAALAGAVGAPGRQRALTIALLAIGAAGSAALLVAGDPAPGLRQRLLVLLACLWQAAQILAAVRAPAGAPTSPRSSAGSRCNTS